MTFYPNRYIPKPNLWFEENVVYKGHGVAEFNDPKGQVEGYTEVVVDAKGYVTAKLYPTNIVPEDSNFDVQNFTNSIRGVIPSLTIPRIYTYTGHRNKCLKLKVDTPQGEFTTLKHDLVYTVDSDDVNYISFCTIISSNFNSNNSSPISYWVVPLWNFLSDCVFHRSDFDNHSLRSNLDNHPLRIYPVIIPNDKFETKEQEFVAFSNAKSRNWIISFGFNGGVGFIERLPKYKKRKKKLISWDVDHLITAVMVGEVNHQPTTLEGLKEWFPFDFVSLLEIATGIEVGYPWIEFRDQEGKLVQRIHKSRGSSNPYKKRPATYRLIPDSDIGTLLTSFASSAKYKETKLRGAIRQFARCGYFNRNFEETLGFLCRGFDEICNLYKVKEPTHLLNQLDDGQLTSKVKEIIDEARTKISSLKNGRTKEQKGVIDSVVNKLPEDPTTSPSFGECIEALLKLSHLNFPDAEIANQYFSTQPKKKSWQHAVTASRNVAAHDNFFNFDSGRDKFPYTQDEVLSITRHLFDLLARVILKTIQFDGFYHPPFYPSPEVKVDWVKDNTSPEDLGY